MSSRSLVSRLLLRTRPEQSVDCRRGRHERSCTFPQDETGTSITGSRHPRTWAATLGEHPRPNKGSKVQTRGRRRRCCSQESTRPAQRARSRPASGPGGGTEGAARDGDVESPLLSIPATIGCRSGPCQMSTDARLEPDGETGRSAAGVCGRAVRLFKLRQPEKAASLGKAIAEPSHRCRQGWCHLLGQVDHGIPQSRHHLRRRTFADTAGVFPHRHITPMMRPVLDPPVTPRQRQQTRRIRALRRQTRDPMHHFHRRLSFHRPLPPKLESLPKSGPLLAFRQDRRRPQGDFLSEPVKPGEGRTDSRRAARRGSAARSRAVNAGNVFSPAGCPTRPGKGKGPSPNAPVRGAQPRCILALTPFRLHCTTVHAMHAMLAMLAMHATTQQRQSW